MPMRTFLLASVLILLNFNANGQDTIPEKPGLLNFFLDCFECDFDYVREELPFVSFVRQPGSADVHILVTDVNTGGGGERFYVNFIGLRSLKDFNRNYEVITSQSDTEDDVRRALLKALKLGILEFYAKAGSLESLNIEILEKENRKAGAMVVDRWNNWVFELQGGLDFEKEARQNEYSLESMVSAEKITENWKTSLRGFYVVDRENYFDDGTKIENRQDSKFLEGSIVKSITGKWSAGVFGGYQSQTFLNIKNNVSLGMGVQYNIFPWSECNRRVFSIGYVAGVDSYGYIEETIYDKMDESHLAEMLLVELDLVQPWGEIRIGLEGRHYFYDLSKNRLSANADFSIRLTKNLSVYTDLETQLIHDQLYLPKGDASLEDILLRRRKLATTYQVEARFGFRFTFGSIYNNVVNERFNNMD